MTISKRKLLDILEGEALRHYRQAMICDAELVPAHIEAARALELAQKMIENRKEQHDENVKTRRPVPLLRAANQRGSANGNDGITELAGRGKGAPPGNEGMG